MSTFAFLLSFQLSFPNHPVLTNFLSVLLCCILFLSLLSKSILLQGEKGIKTPNEFSIGKKHRRIVMQKPDSTCK